MLTILGIGTGVFPPLPCRVMNFLSSSGKAIILQTDRITVGTGTDKQRDFLLFVGCVL